MRAFTGTTGNLATRVCFYTGYAVALAIDMLSIFSASRPIADAGLAVLGAVMQGPLVLLAAGALIAGYVLWKDRPPSAVAQ